MTFNINCDIINIEFNIVIRAFEPLADRVIIALSVDGFFYLMYGVLTMKIKVEHGINLKFKRALKGYTQKAFAEKVGISNARLCNLENKPQQYVSISTANKIVSALNCEWSELFEFEQ